MTRSTPNSKGSVVKPRLRGVSHQAAFAASVPAGLALVALATTGARLAAAIFALSLSALFGVSALYHRRSWQPRARALMRRLDHTMIFVLIAGTYTGVVGPALAAGEARPILTVVWAGAMAGTALQLVWPHAPKPLQAVLYLALGWVALWALPAMARVLSVAGIVLVAAGGVLYSAGALAYATKRPNPVPGVFGYHEVFHALTIAAAICHYLVVLAVVR